MQAASAVKENRAVHQRASTPVGPQRPKPVGWITEHKDDPDEEGGPQSEDETAEELGQHYDAES